MAINQYAEVVCDECGAYDDGDPIDAIDNFGKWLCWIVATRTSPQLRPPAFGWGVVALFGIPA